ncbi:hypothetical protein GQ42DRAFT_50055 [Ramicandelaber brevisporus]|nr:hypothetical protein GQ42DRAFT_50055 [Ramicandelaber brevisporus]
MRFAALFAVAAFAAAVSAQDPTPTVPQGVDQTKPEAVKSYFTSVSSELKSLETQVLTLLPSDKADQAKTLMEAGLKTLEAQIASATNPAQLAGVATGIAIVDAGVKKMAADPKSVASSIAANFDKDMKVASSMINSPATSSKTSAAMSDVSVSAAHLAVGVIAGTAAFAALF